MADFVEFSILEVAAQCGIMVLDCGKTEVTANCPFCDDRKKHLRLNTAKNVYYCPRCGEGGNAIVLYAKLTGTDNKTAYRELTASSVIRPTIIHKQASDAIERVPLLPPAERHAVYTELLQSLDLSKKHRVNLLNRGLCDDVIKKNLYRTTPDFNAANRIAESLSERFSLTGVPGFYTQRRTWKMSLYKGFFIPVRSANGMIQGLKIRLDDTKKRKYRWFSSNHKENGTQAYSWIHVTNIGDNVFVTEGALKADVAAFLSGHCFIGLSGVNCINGLIPILNSMNINRVYEALDMDKQTNNNVAAAACKLRCKLAGAEITCIPCEWDCKYNGIDDFLMFCRDVYV